MSMNFLFSQHIPGHEEGYAAMLVIDACECTSAVAMVPVKRANDRGSAVGPLPDEWKCLDRRVRYLVLVQ